MTHDDGMAALNLASAAFAVAAVAFLAGKHQLDTALGVAASVLVLATCIGAFGPLCGVLVATVLGMATASLLVLVLAPRGSLRRPVAVLGTVAGILLLATSAMAS